MVVAFIDTHRDRFGVEPICTVSSAHGCGIAPSTYYAAKTRPRSARACRDEVVLEHIIRVHTSPVIGRRLYGARKIYKELRREQARGEHPELGHVPRCQVERLMRANELVGVRRGKPVTTTRSDPSMERAPDRVNRNFKAARPNELWVVDFTYVPTWAGTMFTAFVVDVFSRRIVVWWFNNTRLHSAIGYVPPIEFENHYYHHNTPPGSTDPGRTSPPLKPGRFTSTR